MLNSSFTEVYRGTVIMVLQLVCALTSISSKGISFSLSWAIACCVERLYVVVSHTMFRFS